MSIPEDVLKEIKERVACYFDPPYKGNYDKKKFDEMVENEIDNYNQFCSLDFSRFSPDEKDRFLDLFDSYYSDESWARKVYLMDEEIFEFFEAKELLSDDIPEDLFKSWFFDAENNIDQDDFEYDGIYYNVGESIKEKIMKYREKVFAKEKIDPIKKILIEMESIIGNECFNANIQNYAYWGELESEGRFFRYPLTLGEGDNKQKKHVVSSEVPSEDLIKGYYQFGANRIGIYSALYKVLKHLEEKYGFKTPRD